MLVMGDSLLSVSSSWTNQISLEPMIHNGEDEIILDDNSSPRDSSKMTLSGLFHLLRTSAGCQQHGGCEIDFASEFHQMFHSHTSMEPGWQVHVSLFDISPDLIASYRLF
jgi:hypothetical protein